MERETRMPALERGRETAGRPGSGPAAAVRPRRRGMRAVRGVALLEALIAIVLFSLGILGVVGIQGRSVQLLSEATLRSQAAQHASDLIAEMWVTDPATRADLYASGGASPVRYEAWRDRVQAGDLALPGADANPPQVLVETIQTPYAAVSAGVQTVSSVTVTIFWVPPGSDTTNSYTTTAMILEPQS